MSTITKSVGEGGVNAPADVGKIQQLINNNLHLMPKQKRLVVDKKIGKTQRRQLASTNPLL